MALSFLRITPANINAQAVQNGLAQLSEFEAAVPKRLRCNSLGQLITAGNITHFALDPDGSGCVAGAVLDENNKVLALVLAQARGYRSATDLWINALDIRPDLGGRYTEVLQTIGTTAHAAGFTRIGGRPAGEFAARCAVIPTAQLVGEEIWFNV